MGQRSRGHSERHKPNKEKTQWRRCKITQTIALQLEKVRDKVPLLYERDDVLLSMIQQRGDVEKVSSRNMRIPLQVIPGGKAGSYNADGGDLGRGSGTSYDVAQVSPIFFRFAVEISKLVEYATQRAREGHRKRGQARSGQRHEAVPRVPGQGDADGGERRAGHDRLGERHHADDEHAARRGAGLRRARRFRCTTRRSPPTAAPATWSPPIRSARRRRSRWTRCRPEPSPPT